MRRPAVRVRRSDLDLRGVHPVPCDGGHQRRVVPYGESFAAFAFICELIIQPTNEGRDAARTPATTHGHEQAGLHEKLATLD
ncbi:hypothetical protein [Streptomyces mirabilis]|uniref:hypothetical protein n=1 Tax=Streptomyces mirabilis TaxID=68239 RepID=UPI0036C63C99